MKFKKILIKKHITEVVTGLIAIAVCILILIGSVYNQKNKVYEFGVRDYESGLYNEALESFTSVRDFKDSKDYIDKIHDKQEAKERIENKYNAGVDLYLGGHYKKALIIFNSIYNYQDSKLYAELCLLQMDMEKIETEVAK